METKQGSDECCILSKSAPREGAVPTTLSYLDICVHCGKKGLLTIRFLFRSNNLI